MLVEKASAVGPAGVLIGRKMFGLKLMAFNATKGVTRIFGDGWLQMLAALVAKFNVLAVSSKSDAEGERQTMRILNVLPPRDSFKMVVNLESQ